MSRANALAEAKKLKAIMARYGVRCSIELQIGRPYANGDDWFTRKYVLINHHTAGSAKGLTPSLSLVKGGRADLPGPLCNGYGGRDHVYRITTMGLANHPGKGGPLTVAGIHIPKDSARVSTWGTEWEHDGVTPWDLAMQQFMGRSNMALLEYLDRPIEASIEHSTWAPDRKIDRNGYSASTGQAEIKRYGHPEPAPKPVPAPKPPAPVEAPGMELSDTIMLSQAAADMFNAAGERHKDGRPWRKDDTVSVAFLLAWGGPVDYRAITMLADLNTKLDELSRKIDTLRAGG